MKKLTLKHKILLVIFVYAIVSTMTLMILPIVIEISDFLRIFTIFHTGFFSIFILVYNICILRLRLKQNKKD